MEKLKKYSNIIFIAFLAVYTLLACISYLNTNIQFGLYAIIILIPLILDDTKTISGYCYMACFMSCISTGSFLTALNISLAVLQIKKIIIAFITKQNLRDIKRIYLVWFILFVGLTAYSLLMNDFIFHRKGFFINLLQCILVLTLVKNSLNIKFVTFSLFAGILMSTGTAALFNVFNVSNPFVAGYITDRFGGFFNNINSLSAYCPLCSACFICLILTNKLKFKYFFIFPIIITCVGLTTYSKTFILITLILYLSWFVLEFIRSKNKKIFGIYSIFIIIGIIIIAFLGRNYIKTMINRFLDTNFSSILNNFTTGRSEIWKEYLTLWTSSPLTFLFGNGYGAPQIPLGKYEHSIYVAFLYQFGILGSILVVGAIIWCIHYKSKFSKNISSYIPIAIVLINGLSENMTGVLFTSLTLFLGLYFITDNKNEEKLVTNTEERKC